MEFIYQNLNHVLCILLLIGRLGDIISTIIITPKLKLEANPLMRKFKLPFAILTIFICFFPYLHLGFGLSLVIVFYLASFLNISKIWFVKALGEDQVWKLYLYLATKSNITRPIFLSFVAFSFLIAIGIICMLFYPGTDDWGFYVGFGFIAFSVAIQVHTIIFFRRLYRTAKTETYHLTIEKE